MKTVKNNNLDILWFFHENREFRQSKSWLSFFIILVVASSLQAHVFAITADNDATNNQIKNPVLKSTKVPSPRKQMGMGVPPLAVVCNAGFTLVLKASDGFPACVRPSSIDTLVERGWAQNQDWQEHD